MIRLSKTFNDFNEILDELIRVSYSDAVLDFTAFDDREAHYIKTYDDMASMIIGAAYTNIPGINNVSYPNCIGISANAYGFSYMKDNIGLGVSTRYNKKSGEVTYTLTFSFNKDKALLKSNYIYNEAIKAGYDMSESVKTPKK